MPTQQIKKLKTTDSNQCVHLEVPTGILTDPLWHTHPTDGSLRMLVSGLQDMPTNEFANKWVQRSQQDPRFAVACGLLSPGNGSRADLSVVGAGGRPSPCYSAHIPKGNIYNVIDVVVRLDGIRYRPVQGQHNVSRQSVITRVSNDHSQWQSRGSTSMCRLLSRAPYNPTCWLPPVLSPTGMDITGAGSHPQSPRSLPNDGYDCPPQPVAGSNHHAFTPP